MTPSVGDVITLVELQRGKMASTKVQYACSIDHCLVAGDEESGVLKV